jgi:redox-sensitive bicupin YhaK (pirin superfamily)
MEIVTYIVDGALQHKDSIGGGGVIGPGEIQRMSAGHGIVHAEFNASADTPCHLIQIWIQPSRHGIEPGYEQKTIPAAAMAGHFARIAGPDPQADEVRLVQDAEIWVAKCDAGVEVIHSLRPGRKAWLHVVRGTVHLGGVALDAGDAAGLTDMPQIQIRSESAAELLLFDVA